MNCIITSPNFPPHGYKFCRALKNSGANVLGIGDEEYFNLLPELREVLTEYYKVGSMHDYSEMLKACGYFIFRYGKIGCIESHNEYWLETDAKLRTDFNVPGIKANEIESMQYKSKMKKKFIAAHVPIIEGEIINTKEEALNFIKNTGYPVIAKPDKGVGASDTFKIHNEDELNSFFQNKPDLIYFMEQFIKGTIYSFDGLVDKDGKIAFCTCHKYNSGVMEILHHDLDLYYYSLREIPDKLYEYGERIINTYKIKERFFHFEFFKIEGEKKEKYVALEVNMRPPGGWTVDMFNYSADIDLYQEWANIIVKNEFTSKGYTRKYHSCYISRKNNRNYLYSQDDIVREYGHLISCYEEMKGIFAHVMGNFGYIIRSPDIDELLNAVQFIQKLKENGGN
ncbi:MAG: ATP-grasp domain-containing protein [Desulfobacterales bacterium]|nr:ATP-grasp domain-containing protein [Desulfobacterales bacterium]